MFQTLIHTISTNEMHTALQLARTIGRVFSALGTLVHTFIALLIVNSVYSLSMSLLVCLAIVAFFIPTYAVFLSWVNNYDKPVVHTQYVERH